MTDLAAALLALADRFTAAVEAGDQETLRDCFGDDLVVSANFSGADNDREGALRLLRWLHRSVDGLHYEIVRRDAFGDGYVQQHVLTGTAPDGSALRAPACLVVYVRDGCITRIDEYLDSAHVRALLP